jgi:hypothetical protein
VNQTSYEYPGDEFCSLQLYLVLLVSSPLLVSTVRRTNTLRAQSQLADLKWTKKTTGLTENVE